MSQRLKRLLKKFNQDSSSRIFIQLADEYRKLGHLSEAMKVLAFGGKLHPQDASSRLVWAQCYCGLSDYEKAYDILKPALDSSADNFLLRKIFADICMELGRRHEALDCYKYLLFLRPRDEEIKKAVAILEADEVEAEIESVIVEQEAVASSDDIGLWDVSEIADISEKEETKKEIPDFKVLDFYIKKNHLKEAESYIAALKKVDPRDKQLTEKLNEIKELQKNGESETVLTVAPDHNVNEGAPLERKLLLFLSELKKHFSRQLTSEELFRP